MSTPYISGVKPLTAVGMDTGQPLVQGPVESLPAEAGPAASPSDAMKNFAEVSQTPKLPGVLTQLTNNMTATFKMTMYGLKEGVKVWADTVENGSGGNYLILVRFIVASASLLLYEGSLLAGAITKAVLWLPVIGLTAAAGGIGGAVAFLRYAHDNDKRKNKAAEAALFCSNCVGGALASINSIIATISILGRGPIILAGWLGGLGLYSMKFGKFHLLDSQKEVADLEHLKLFTPLLMSIQDSLIGTSVWFMAQNREEISLLKYMGANVEAVDPIKRKYTIPLSFPKKDVLSELLEKNLINKLYGNQLEHSSSLSAKVDATDLQHSTDTGKIAVNFNDLPPIAGAKTPTEVLDYNLRKIRKRKLPGVLQQLTNNAVATYKMTASGLKEVSKLAKNYLSKGNVYALLPRFFVAAFPVLFYGGSLVIGAIIKAALWLPVIGVTAVSGGIVGGVAGATAFLLSGFKKDAAKTWAREAALFTSNFVGGSLTSLDSVFIASLSLLFRGPITLLGQVGASWMAWLGTSTDQDFEVADVKLWASLEMALQDSLGLWTGYTTSIWGRNAERDYEGKDLSEMRLTHLPAMGANIEEIDLYYNDYSLKRNSDPSWFIDYSEWDYVKQKPIMVDSEVPRKKRRDEWKGWLSKLLDKVVIDKLYGSNA